MTTIKDISRGQRPPAVRTFRYREQDYDTNGHLKAPPGLWVCIIWLLLPWWLTGAGMAQQQMTDIACLYPTLTDSVVALACGIPAVAVCFVYPLRGEFPRTARWSYLLMLISGLSADGYSGFQLTTGGIRDSDSVLLQGGVLCLNLAALLFLVLNTRLWHVFARRTELH
ncbi:DUF2919 family protein [Salmonella enterica]|nr:DUF2919 family protein [Salmonella enterica]ECX3455636.1 DUF2919 domain-containing protein [Salmonella enterica subsp. enterica serovar Rubislaw]EDT4766962.1 DUF2919 domain-containing protein [Salmonella enterica subsp. enterica serovar Florida]EBC2267862.1 DUF2919 domain-containing protein [Salmonella enterica]ECX7631583.1 DUF2919 domain-containing protein [Salmonella enterica]